MNDEQPPGQMCAECGKPIDKRDALVGVNDDGHHAHYSYALLCPGGIYKRVFHAGCVSTHPATPPSSPASR